MLQESRESWKRVSSLTGRYQASWERKRRRPHGSSRDQIQDALMSVWVFVPLVVKDREFGGGQQRYKIRQF